MTTRNNHVVKSVLTNFSIWSQSINLSLLFQKSNTDVTNDVSGQEKPNHRAAAKMWSYVNLWKLLFYTMRPAPVHAPYGEKNHVLSRESIIW